MNNGNYMLRSCVVRMPISAKFTTFSQRPMSREQVAGVALRNRPVKAFRQIKTYVNGLISTRLPEELEFVEEHLEEDYAYGMDFPNEGECLPVVCPREYTSGAVADRPGYTDLVSTVRDTKAHEFSIESTSNHNFQQRSHQFRDDFNVSTQTYSGDIEFPVRCGPFQPYRSAKTLGNSIIPYVGEAMLEFNWRQYQSQDSNAEVYKIDGSGAYIQQDGSGFYWQDQQSTHDRAAPLGDERKVIVQPRHMDVAKYLFEAGGSLAQSARASGSFGARGTTEPFCLAVAYNGGQEGSFLIQPYDQPAVASWYNGDGQVGMTADYALDAMHVAYHINNLHNVGLKSSLDLKTGFRNAYDIDRGFRNGALLNFDTQWLIENTDLSEADAAFECVVGARQLPAPTVATGGDPSAAPTEQNRYVNTGAFGPTQNDKAINIPAVAGSEVSGALLPGLAASTIHAGMSQTTFVGSGAQNFKKRALRINVLGANIIENNDTAGKQFQLANPLGLESQLIFFQPNDLSLSDKSAAAELRNPEVVYAVWEVYDDAFIEQASRSFARGQSVDITNGGFRAQQKRSVQELEYKLSVRNYKNGQILGAWVPSARLYTALDNMDRTTQATGLVDIAAKAKGERGDRPLYNGDEENLVNVINETYSILVGAAIPFGFAERRALWELATTTTDHANRDSLQQEIMYNINRASGINLWQAGAGVDIAAFTALRSTTGNGLGGGAGGVNQTGQYNKFSMIIPRGTRIRLKTFHHIGISKDLQCLGARAVDYAAPDALADCVDFNWEEHRGRFPYQLIQPRGDNYSGKVTPSGQGDRGFVYEDAIKNIQLSWRQQPELVCEWIILPPAKVQPTYRLAYPEHEFFRALFPSPTFNLPSIGNTQDVAIRGLKLNEVPNKVYIYCMLTEQSRNYLEWLDCKPTISHIETTINETVDTTSHIPLWLGYRFFKENSPYSTKTKDEWVQDNMWILSPQNLNITAETFTESMARVSTMSVVATVRMNRAYRQIAANYSPALFPGSKATAASVMKPEFEVRVVITYDNHSLIMNSRHEMLIEKNTLATQGPTGLVKQDRGLPRQGGLAFY